MAEGPAKYTSPFLRTNQTASGTSWWGERSVWTRHVTYWSLAIVLISLTAFDSRAPNTSRATHSITAIVALLTVALVVGLMGLVGTTREWEQVGLARTLSRSLVLFLWILGMASFALVVARHWVAVQECTTRSGQEVCGGAASPRQVLALLAWQSADAVPVLNLTGAFEWTRPARSDSAAVGTAIVVLRLWVVIGLLSVIKRLWDKWGTTGTAQVPSAEEAG
jgi:hypothetical protein